MNNYLKEFCRSDKLLALHASFELARRKLIPFCLLQNSYYEKSSHLIHIANALERVERGEIKKLMVFCPPRHGKSKLVSVNFPAWYLGRNPDNNIIISSYAASLAEEFSGQSRGLVEDELYRAVFGVSTNPRSRGVKSWEMGSGFRGGLMAVGVCGGATGFGANIFVIDDPVKNHIEAFSKIYREKVYAWYQSVASTRLEPGGAIILMMARWHQDDLAGRILKEEPGEWEVINFEATAGDNDPLGREKGQALWPQRYDVEAIGKIKKTIGTKFFNALFRGTPDDPESQIIKRDWIKYYKKLPIEYSRFGGIDTATSSKTIADNTSMVDVCKDWEGYLYVDDCFLDKISVYGFSKHVNAQHAAKKYSLIKLEANNAGEAIKQRIDEVGRDTKLGSHPPVRAETTTTDKCVRVSEIAPLIENGTLRFKLGDPRIAKLIDHLIAFDGKDSDIDDDVDALGFAVKAAIGGAAFFSSTNNYDVYQKGQK